LRTTYAANRRWGFELQTSKFNKTSLLAEKFNFKLKPQWRLGAVKRRFYLILVVECIEIIL